MGHLGRHLLWWGGHRNNNGFTLVELLVSLAVAAIMLTVAVPSYSGFVKNNRLITQANEFITSLQLARSEAVKRNTYVTVCKSADSATCNASGTWDQGWIVFVDTDSDAAVDNGEDILRAQTALDGSTSFSAQTDVANYISYQSMGFAQLTNGTVQQGQLMLCDDRGFISNSKAIDLSAAGRPRVTEPSEYGITSCSL